ncbi:cold shock domain-containing protein [Frigidibacter sp. MR17.14]
MTEQAQIDGRVKWFDPAKGFGFILSDAGGPDILLHANVLRNFGQSSVADGARISVRVQQTQRGAQATEVLAIEPPEGEELTQIEDVDDGNAEEIAGLPMLAARVKWFDKGKGFGFANIWGRPEDVFIHAEILRRAGFADLGPGEAIAIRVIDGKRGKMAAQILSWESAMRTPGADEA